jgi:peroxiredoxin Q/BCP
MTRTVTTALLLAAIFATSAFAALKPGEAAPDFTAQATLGGKEFTFALADALKKGPVVLYFFPKAFTTGCTEEAYQFAEASAQFTEAGATLIGMSGDDIDTLHKFSVQACSSKFPVAADPDLKVVKAYDSAMIRVGSIGLAARISYVISPDGKIAYAYADRSPDKHVENTLAAVKAITKK